MSTVAVMKTALHLIDSHSVLALTTRRESLCSHDQGCQFCSFPPSWVRLRPCPTGKFSMLQVAFYGWFSFSHFFRATMVSDVLQALATMVF